MTAETILIVDDEEPVRRTFQEWLAGSGLPCEVLVAADAEAALRLANRRPIDLAVLDWNLGAGNDGLRLLEDLSVFQPDIVAILVTGYAHQATPLNALRMGVRDYLDKNQDLNRQTFLAAVRRQLDRIRPAKQHRELHRQLAAFRAAVEKVLPLVQSSAALSDPEPLPTAVSSLCRFLRHVTGAADTVLLIRHVADQDGAETCRVYDSAGAPLAVELVPFARSLAATAVSMGEPSVMNNLADTTASTVELQPFERGRKSVLATPLAVGPGVHAVLELFDKPGGFTAADRQLAAAAADIGTELLRQALADRQTQTTLFDALGAALEATRVVTDRAPPDRPEEPPPAAVLEALRENLTTGRATAEADAALRLAEAVRALAVRHGAPAVEHCIRVVESLRKMLDANAG